MTGIRKPAEENVGSWIHAKADTAPLKEGTSTAAPSEWCEARPDFLNRMTKFIIN